VDEDEVSRSQPAAIGDSGDHLGPRLRRALDDGRLRVVYQPKISLADGSVHGIEALARWDEPGLGAVAPDRFIPLAERAGLIGDLGAFVLDMASRTAARWNRAHAGHVPIRVAVNVSPFQLGDPSFYAEVSRAVDLSGLIPELLILEITESAFVGPDIARLLWRIKDLGVRFAMDDFGTGFSNLSYLARLPLDQVKIDRSLVGPSSYDDRTRTLLQSVSKLVHDVGLAVVAEGIETPAQGALARSIGCDVAQGFLFARPIEAEGLDELLVVEQRSHQLVDGWSTETPPAQRDPDVTILVVDDDPVAAHLTRYLLTTLVSARVITAATGDQFETAMRCETPDLVLMDLHMPHRSGFDLLAAMPRLAKDIRIPVVALTAYPEAVHPEHLGDDGFAAVLAKPIEPAAFVDQVGAFLPPTLPPTTRRLDRCVRSAAGG